MEKKGKATGEKWRRRDMLKMLGAAAAFPAVAGGRTTGSQEILPTLQGQDNWLKPKRPLTAIVIGAGARGNVYSGYAAKFPEELKIVGVAEPIPYRNEHLAKTYGIPEENRFVTWEHVFERPRFADVLIITTPDHLHYGPAMKGLEQGYDMILEKVIAQTWKECKDILDLATKKKNIVAVCHVMRYTSYFRQFKRVLESGRLGELISVQHLEPVEHIHMSHSFVRGNWRNSRESNPMILSKSCHDLDILRWLIDKPSRRVSSFGSLKLFRREMAPAGATKRCTDGCPAEKECPYSALKIYLKRKIYLYHLKTEDYEEKTILKALQEGPYGRCVYACDNDVVDHQVVNVQFEDQITAAFSMEGLTSYAGRRTRVMGSLGDLVGDERELSLYDFRTRKQYKWDVSQAGPSVSGHGGGDWGLVRDFVQAVSRKDPSLLSSTLAASMESHLLGFRAEESRLNHKTLAIDLGQI